MIRDGHMSTQFCGAQVSNQARECLGCCYQGVTYIERI